MQCDSWMTTTETMPANGSAERTGSKSVALILAAWFCLAAGSGIAGWLEPASAPIIAIIVWSLTALALLACWKVPMLKEWTIRVDLRWLVLPHLSRFVGFYFFYLCSRGELPFDFAAPAGWGDNVVATLAILLLALSGARKWKMLIAWNTIGLTDILFVVMTALRLGAGGPAIDACLAGIPAQLAAFFSRAADYRVARSDFFPSGSVEGGLLIPVAVSLCEAREHAPLYKRAKPQQALRTAKRLQENEHEYEKPQRNLSTETHSRRETDCRHELDRWA